MQEYASILTSFNKMMRFWDELQSMEPMHQYACSAIKSWKCDLLKKIHELEMRNQLMQFLMSPNSSYDQAYGQILSMDPLPPINQAYYVI